MARLFIDIEARFAQVQDALNQITRNTERASKQMSRAFDGVKQSIATLGVGVGVGAFGRELVRSTIEAEKSAARLDAALKATGGSIGLTRRELDELADSMQGAFGIDDDQVKAAQATLIRFGNIQGDVFREGLKLSADLAAALGTDITSAAQLVGKALQSPTEGLRGLEQNFGKLDEATEKNINSLVKQGKTIEAQREILRLFQDRVGGAAAALNDGLNRALNSVTNSWDDFLKALGKTEGPMRVVRDAFGGLAVVLQTIKGLIETPPAEAGLAPLAEEVKKIDKELTKLNARQAELNAKQSIGHAEAVERLKNEEEINRKLARRTQLVREYNDLNDKITRDREAELESARAKQGTPTAGGGAKESPEGKLLERTLENMREQIESLKGITVQEKTLQDIRRGAFGEVDAATQKKLLGYAKEIDALKRLQVQAQILKQTQDLLSRATPLPLGESREEMEQFWREHIKRANDAAVALEKVREEVQRTSDAFLAGVPTQDLAVEQDMVGFWARVAVEQKKATDDISDAAKDLGFTFQSAFEDAILEGEKFSDVLKAIEKDIARIILRMTITKPLGEGLAGLIGEGLKGIFTGGGGDVTSQTGPGFEDQLRRRASGGSVFAGGRFLVGEEGPELFVPGRSGTIVPNDALGGISISNGDIIINGGGVTMTEVRQALAAQQRQTIEAVRELNRR
jgi:hypothetical protein